MGCYMTSPWAALSPPHAPQATSPSPEPGCTHCLVVMGPLSSMGSPMTFMILPRVSGPTGIRMGVPESSTFWPLTSPSVPSIAMVRTVFSPGREGARGQQDIGVSTMLCPPP